MADALSRLPIGEINNLTIGVFPSELLRRVEESWDKDEHLQTVTVSKMQDPSAYEGYSWHHDKLWKQGRYVVKKDHAMKQDLIVLFHDSALGGEGRAWVVGVVGGSLRGECQPNNWL